MKALLAAAATLLAAPAAAPVHDAPVYDARWTPTLNVGPILPLCAQALRARAAGDEAWLLRHLIETQPPMPRARRIVETCRVFELGAEMLAAMLVERARPRT